MSDIQKAGRYSSGLDSLESSYESSVASSPPSNFLDPLEININGYRSQRRGSPGIGLSKDDSDCDVFIENSGYLRHRQLDRLITSSESRSHSTGSLTTLTTNDWDSTDMSVDSPSLSDSETEYFSKSTARFRRGSAPVSIKDLHKFHVVQQQIAEEDESNDQEAKCPEVPITIPRKKSLGRRGSAPPGYFTDKAQKIDGNSESTPLKSSILRNFYNSLTDGNKLDHHSSTEDLEEAYKKVHITADPQKTTEAHHKSKLFAFMGVPGYEKPPDGSPERKQKWLNSIFAPNPSTSKATGPDHPDGSAGQMIENVPKKTIRKRDVNCFAPISM